MSQETDTEAVPRKEETDVGGLTPEMASVLAYLLSPLSGVIVFVMEKEDDFTRFHAMQAIVFGVAWFAIWTVFSIFGSVTLGFGFLLFPVVALVHLATLGFMMYKAYSGDRWGIPGVEGFVEDQI